MNDSLRYLKYYSQYIKEQDEFADAGGEGEPMAAAPKVVDKFKFIFIDGNDKDNTDYTYPDGSESRRYDTFEVSKDELDEWLDKNISTSDGLSKNAAEVKRKSLLEYISGKKTSLSPEDKKFIDQFKNAVNSEIIGKQIQDTEVIFSPGENIPTTDEVDVTFIKVPING